MADTLESMSANILDPRIANDKRKALLQMLMQRAQGGSASLSSNASSGGPVTPGGTSFLGGMRPIPRNRSGLGNTNFVQGSQVAAQFLNGMGVGSRQMPGDPLPPQGPPHGGVPVQGGTQVPVDVSNGFMDHPPVYSPANPQSPPGQILAQFLSGPAGGGASGASTAPQPTAAAPAGAPVGAPGAGVDGAPNLGRPAPPMISLGGGAYYNPSTQLVHYTSSGGRVAN